MKCGAGQCVLSNAESAYRHTAQHSRRGTRPVQIYSPAGISMQLNAMRHACACQE